MRSYKAALATLLVATAAHRPVQAAAPPDASLDEDHHEVLGTSLGGYGGAEMKGTAVAGIPAILLGVQGAFVFNRHFVLGAAGYTLATTQAPSQELARPEGPSHLQLAYGGAQVAYVLWPHDTFHFRAGVLVGAGGVSVLTEDIAQDLKRNHDGGGFFVLEPQADLEISLHRYVRLAFVGSYRFINGFDQPRLHTSDLSGPAGSVAMRIGSF